LVTTEIASAVDSVPLGDFSFVRPSSVTPPRSSRKMVTTRRISSAPGASCGSSSARPSWDTRRATISTSSSTPAGTGSTTVLNRRRSAEDSSLTPRSRSLAVAITLNPLRACTSAFSSGTGRVRSDSTVMSESWTSDGIRVSSSTRAMLPVAMARSTGLSTSAARDGPSAISRA
jgi:hypothetical protein